MSRRRRIALGSGTEPHEVTQLLKQLNAVRPIHGLKLRTVAPDFTLGLRAHAPPPNFPLRLAELPPASR